MAMRPGLILLGFASGLIACSGGGGSGNAPSGPKPTATAGATTTPNANATSTPTARATATASGSATATPTATAAGAVLVVGPGQQYATLAAAAAAAVDGDTIDVVAGTYTNDFAGYIGANVTIQGVGGMVHELYTTAPPNEKAPLTVEKGLTLKNFEISGVTISAAEGNNGAAIRLEGGNLFVQYCYIHDNQDGILADAVTGATVTIDHTEFARNGAGDGFSHNLYINAVASLTFTNDYSHDANVGHDLKSRALATTIQNSVIADGPSGTASYEIDIPNAGVALIENSFIEKGPLAQNSNMIHYGGESLAAAYPSNSLTISGGTMVNAYGSSAVAISNQASSVAAGLSVTPVVSTNVFWGFGASNIVQGGPAPSMSGNTINPTTSGAPAIPTTPPWASAPVIPVPSAHARGR
jgi:hypothetical protein